ETWAALIAREPASAHRSGLAKAWENLGNLHLRLGKFEQAETGYRTATTLREELAGSSPAGGDATRPGTGYANLGRACAARGQIELAQAAYLRALTLQRQLVTVTPPSADRYQDLGRTCHNLAQFSRERGQPAEAQTLFREALEALQEV